MSPSPLPSGTAFSGGIFADNSYGEKRCPNSSTLFSHNPQPIVRQLWGRSPSHPDESIRLHFYCGRLAGYPLSRSNPGSVYLQNCALGAKNPRQTEAWRGKMFIKPFQCSWCRDYDGSYLSCCHNRNSNRRRSHGGIHRRA